MVVEKFFYKMDRITFDDSKYINLLIDYEELKRKKKKNTAFYFTSRTKIIIY